MRATYTGGVIDAFLDHAIDIPYVIGVSAGANAGSDYVSGQRERNHRMFIELASHPRYAGFRNLVHERSWFGMRLLFETAPDRVVPFDYDAFAGSRKLLVVGVTDCATGRAMYFRHHDSDPRWFVRNVLRASSSLPMLSPAVSVRGRLCCDGGVSDSIPIERSLADDNPFNVVVLTRNAGYRKPPSRYGAVARLLLRHSPGVLEASRSRHLRYNRTLERIERLERTGEVFVLRPIRPLVVGRMERDIGKLEALYRQGYDETVERLPALREWMRAHGDSIR